MSGVVFSIGLLPVTPPLLVEFVKNFFNWNISNPEIDCLRPWITRTELIDLNAKRPDWRWRRSRPTVSVSLGTDVKFLPAFVTKQLLSIGRHVTKNGGSTAGIVFIPFLLADGKESFLCATWVFWNWRPFCVLKRVPLFYFWAAGCHRLRGRLRWTRSSVDP